MPIEQVPLTLLAVGVPRLMSVVPELGSDCLMLRLGIRIAEEQSKVPLVATRRVVGRPAWAIVVAGE